MATKKFVSLISGGFDSPLASTLMMKQGFLPIFLSFLTSDDQTHSMKNKVINLITFLKRFTNFNLKVYFIDYDSHLNSLKLKCERKLTCVLCKRLMLRIAKKIGIFENTNIIVTGDILGEQASQTLDNLYSYNDLIKDCIILRPLIAYDKNEVIYAIRELGLYNLISQSSASCLFNPQYPETHAKRREIEISESNINITELVDKALGRAEIIIL